MDSQARGGASQPQIISSKHPISQILMVAIHSSQILIEWLESGVYSLAKLRIQKLKDIIILLEFKEM